MVIFLLYCGHKMFGENQSLFHPPGTEGTVDDERRVGKRRSGATHWRTDGEDRMEGEKSRGMAGDTVGGQSPAVASSAERCGD